MSQFNSVSNDQLVNESVARTHQNFGNPHQGASNAHLNGDSSDSDFDTENESLSDCEHELTPRYRPDGSGNYVVGLDKAMPQAQGYGYANDHAHAHAYGPAHNAHSPYGDNTVINSQGETSKQKKKKNSKACVIWCVVGAVVVAAAVSVFVAVCCCKSKDGTYFVCLGKFRRNL